MSGKNINKEAYYGSNSFHNDFRHDFHKPFSPFSGKAQWLHLVQELPMSGPPGPLPAGCSTNTTTTATTTITTGQARQWYARPHPGGHPQLVQVEATDRKSIMWHTLTVRAASPMLATLTMFQAVAMFVEGGIRVMETQMRNKAWTSLSLDMDLHFALGIPGRNFAAPKQYFRWKFSEISSYYQKV